MRHLPQADHADLGLIPDSDHTEDMRTAPVIPGAPTPGGSRRNPSIRTEQNRNEY